MSLTIYSIACDTTSNTGDNFNKIKEKEEEIFGYTNTIINNCIKKSFAGNLKEDIKLVKEENVDRILFQYKTSCNETLTAAICDEWISNSKRKQYLNHIQECLTKRADSLDIDTTDLKAEYDTAINNAFSGFGAFFGFISNSNIAKIDDIFNKYIEKINEIEEAQQENLLHNLFSDEEVENSFNTTINEFKNFAPDFTGSHNINNELKYNAKFDFPTKQYDEHCVLHASINASRQNPNGEQLINRLLKLHDFECDKGRLLVCIPEAERDDKFYFRGHSANSVGYYSVRHSDGDPDEAAFIESVDSYYNSSNIHYGNYAARGFEVLSGEKAQIFTSDKKIPTGVGLTYNKYPNILYNNLKELLDNSDGAVVCSLNKYSHRASGDVVDNIEDENILTEAPYISDGHAYSLIKLTDEYAYLQDSNNPKTYIRINKNTFTKILDQVGTWKYDKN